MLQREVADRLVAPPGSKEYGVLSILIGHMADVATVLKLPAGAFRPAPKVLSSLVQLRFRTPQPAVLDAGVFERVVQAVFTRRRKTMSNALLALEPALSHQLAPMEALTAAGSTVPGGRKHSRSLNSRASPTSMYARGELCYSLPVTIGSVRL